MFQEAEEALRELKAKAGDVDLTKMIQMRQAAREASRDSFLDQLEAKYSKPKPGKKKTK